MSLPRKKLNDVNTNPIKSADYYNNMGVDRVIEMLYKTDENTTYFPQEIGLEDLDNAFFEYFNESDDFVIEGNKINVFYLQYERWAEFQKTWVLVDEDKNVKTPYITIRRTEKKKGTRYGEIYRIPTPQLFTYVNVPVWENEKVIFLKYKVPEPINIDLVYEVNFISKYRTEINEIDSIIFKKFASILDYVYIKDEVIPIKLEDVTEPDVANDVNNEKLYISKYNFTLKGFIRRKEEFKVVKTYRGINMDYSF